MLPDLETLPNGDLTEIGEKGVNLSGGQKQRISLARAVYSQADLLLLDDPLSAVDSHVARKLLNMFQSPLVAKSSIVLCTHHVHAVGFADQIILLSRGKAAKGVANGASENAPDTWITDACLFKTVVFLLSIRPVRLMFFSFRFHISLTARPC